MPLRAMFFLSLVFGLFPFTTASAQTQVTYTVTQTVIVARVASWQSNPVRFQNISRDGKRLPPGYHDFIAKVPERHTAFSVGVVCRDWRKAISFAQRLKEGYDAPGAMVEVNRQNGNTPQCGVFKHNIDLVSDAVAVRGGRGDFRVEIVRLVDPYGGVHYRPKPIWE